MRNQRHRGGNVTLNDVSCPPSGRLCRSSRWQCSLLLFAILTTIFYSFLYFDLISVVSVTFSHTQTSSHHRLIIRHLSDIREKRKCDGRNVNRSSTIGNGIDDTASDRLASKSHLPTVTYDRNSFPSDAELTIAFKSVMRDSERAVLGAMLKLLTDILDIANITYHMCGGTLIGSYRHHGMIPWDDDVDIYVPWSKRHQIDGEIRRRMYPAGYRIVQRKTIWKLYPTSTEMSSAIPRWSWRYPFVDICFYLEDSKSVWDPEVRWFSNFRFPLSVVFPLHRRPFMNMSLWAPNDVETYLRLTYGNLSRCSTHHYSHRYERGADGHTQTVDCRRLWPLHPFVFRSTESHQNGSVISVEELRVRDRVLNISRIKSPS